jgi:hypothetical protein
MAWLAPLLFSLRMPFPAVLQKRKEPRTPKEGAGFIVGNDSPIANSSQLVEYWIISRGKPRSPLSLHFNGTLYGSPQEQSIQ